MDKNYIPPRKEGFSLVIHHDVVRDLTSLQFDCFLSVSARVRCRDCLHSACSLCSHLREAAALKCTTLGNLFRRSDPALYNANPMDRWSTRTAQQVHEAHGSPWIYRKQADYRIVSHLVTRVRPSLQTLSAFPRATVRDRYAKQPLCS